MSALLETARANLARIARSKGVWALLLIAPISARVWLPREGGESTVISVNARSPELTAPMLGVSLGIVVATLLWPLAYAYLRAGATRRQPWALIDVTPASRIARTYGMWLSFVALFAALLTMLTLAGWILGLTLIGPGAISYSAIAFALWVTAFPALCLAAGLYVLLQALSVTRGAGGDVLFFVCWTVGLVAAIAAGSTGSAQAPFFDYGGFIAPLSYGLNPDDLEIAIGGSPETKGRIALAVTPALTAPNYLAARSLWLAIAAALPLLAGAAWAPHRARKPQRAGWLSALAMARLWAAPKASLQPAAKAGLAWLGLVTDEIAALLRQPLFLIAVAAIAVLGVAQPYRAFAGPASMLLLLFPATARAGWRASTGMAPLLRTLPTPAVGRGLALVVAVTALSLAMAAPAQILNSAAAAAPLALAAASGVVTGGFAVVLASFTGSAFVGRLALLALWYGYFASNGMM
jgi:hypothetical protein